jgi:hypothetical protein
VAAYNFCHKERKMPTKPLPPVNAGGCSTVSFEDLIGPVKKSLLTLYTLKRTTARDGKYDGYGNHGTILATSFDPDEQLDPSGLRYDRERGRQPIDVILRVAFQLGYSQCSIMAEHRENQTREMFVERIESRDQYIKLLEQRLAEAKADKKKKAKKK